MGSPCLEQIPLSGHSQEGALLAPGTFSTFKTVTKTQKQEVFVEIAVSPKRRRVLRQIDRRFFCHRCPYSAKEDQQMRVGGDLRRFQPTLSLVPISHTRLFAEVW